MGVEVVVARLAIGATTVIRTARWCAGALRRGARRLSAIADRWFTQARIGFGLMAALAALGMVAICDLAVIVSIAADLTDDSTSRVVEVANRYARVTIEDPAA